MKFLAKFIGDAPEYYRIVFADNANEATTLAEKMKRKGFKLVSVKQVL